MFVVVGGPILLVAHKGSVDVCTRQLIGKPRRNRKSFRPLVNQVPFCAFGACQQDTRGKWQLVAPPIDTFTHHGNKAYNWAIWKK